MNNGVSPPYATGNKGHDSIEQLLLNKGVDINSGDFNGRTPLFKLTYKAQFNLYSSTAQKLIHVCIMELIFFILLVTLQ